MTVRYNYNISELKRVRNRLLKEIRLNEGPCKKPRYWGKGGAGMMFICSEDQTLLLLKRAGWVEQGGTWGIPGGGIGEGYENTPIKEPITNSGVFYSQAETEVMEECGSMPPFYSEDQVIAKTEYEDCGFKYVTQIVDITARQKQDWKFKSTDGETDEFKWFPISKLPSPLHFGVKFTLDKFSFPPPSGKKSELRPGSKQGQNQDKVDFQSLMK